MILIKELSLNNFLSHKKTVLQLKPDQKLLIDGRSGSGKSSIVDALLYVLYGRGRVDNRSLIKYGETNTKVSVILEDDKLNSIIKIERSTTSDGKNTLKISQKTSKGNFLPIKITGLKALQEHIEKEILHSSFLLFINSIIFPQDNIDNFVKQTASKRKDIILEIANVEAYDEYYEKTKNELTNQTSLISNHEAVINSLKENITNDKNNANGIEEYKKSLESIEKQLSEKNDEQQKLLKNEAVIENMRSQLTEKQMEIIKIENEYNSYNNKIEESNKKLIQLDDSEIKKLSEEVKDIDKWKTDLEILKLNEEKVSTWQKEMLILIKEKPVDLNFEKIIENINEKLIENIQKKVLMCPDLNKECPHFAKERDNQTAQLEEMLEEKQKEYDDYKIILKNYNDKVSKLGEMPDSKLEEIKNIESIITNKELKSKNLDRMKMEKDSLSNSLEEIIIESQKKVEELSSLLLSKKQEINELKELVDNTPTRENDINILNSEINSLQTQKNGLIASIALSEKALISLKENTDKLNKLESEIADGLEKVDCLKLLKEAFGQNGIKAMVIDYLIPQLEDRINNILGKLSDFRVQINTQKSGVKGDTTIEGLFISIFNEIGTELDFASYSGGEKVKIVTAINEALASFSKVNFRVFDEAVVSLDNESTQKFLMALDEIQNRVSQVICVSHIPEVKEIFEDKIEIVKIKGDSIIK